ncbi:MAG TPA: SPOR domain-containing protein, partial [Immundisolibacter sp.]
MTTPVRGPARHAWRRLATAGALLAGGVCACATAAPLTAVRVVGFDNAGSAAVVAGRVRQLGSPALVRRVAHDVYVVQAGAFANLGLAQRQAARLQAAGLGQVSLQAVGPVAAEVSFFAPAEPSDRPAPTDSPAGSASPPHPPSPQAPLTVIGITPPASMVLALGDDAPPPGLAPAGAGPSAVAWQVNRLQAETAAFTGDDRLARHAQFLHATGGMVWQPSAATQLRLSARGDAFWQQGWRDYDEAQLDYDEVYLRHRWSGLRLTAGAQRVAWGRVDEIAPTDRLSVVDLTRMVLDRLPERRRTVPALRAEWFGMPGKLDLVWIPAFRPAELPDDDSAWHPVNRRDGRFFGLPRSELQGALIKAGRFDDDGSGSGGGGLRYSQELSGFDYALSAQRVRHSTPYYELDERVREALTVGSSVPAAVALAPDTFVGRHPYTWALGGDAGFTTGRTTWRVEAAWLSAVPVTDSAGALDTVDAVNAVAGAEFYPGDRDLRVNLQVGANILLGPASMLDRRRRYFTNGTVLYP